MEKNQNVGTKSAFTPKNFGWIFALGWVNFSINLWSILWYWQIVELVF